MKVIKNINNNISLCLDSRNNEVVAFGKGIGFTKPPYDVPLSKIDRTRNSWPCSTASRKMCWKPPPRS